MKMRYNDSPHDVIYEVELANNAELHRFDNPGGCPYSAIYVNGVEEWSCERGHEAKMIYDWNQKYGPVEKDVETIECNNGYSIRRFTDAYDIRWSELRQNGDVRAMVPVEAEKSLIEYWNQVIEWFEKNHADNPMRMFFAFPLVVDD